MKGVATKLRRPSSRPVPLRNPIVEAWTKQQEAAAELYRAKTNPIVPFRDPFEDFVVEEETKDDAAERSTMGCFPCQPHHATTQNQIQPSDVAQSPPVAGDGGGENEESNEVQSDEEFPRREKTAELARIQIQEVMSNFNEEQMRRYEAFRNARFHKSKIKKILAALIGNNNFSEELNIVVSALAKLFVGDLVETARVVMIEKKDSGPIRPCHIRESYRRLKLGGKTFKRTIPRLFR